MKLSIVIPTYNRNPILLANIVHLLPQLQPGVELKILDNASRTAVSETLSDELKKYPDAAIEVIRNKVNVGACANILRSFEVANSAWVWILGDDDRVSDTAVRDVLECIAARPDATFINFSTELMRRNGLRRVPFDTKGQEGFVDGFDDAGNVNFMSVSIWRIAPVLGSLNLGYHYAYSMSYPFVLLLAGLGKDGICHFSDRVLVLEVTTDANTSKWRFQDFIMGWNTILELPMPEPTREKLSRKMMTWHSPENVCALFLADAALGGKGSRAYVMISRRLASHVNRFERLRFLAYRLLFIHPPAGWWIVQTAAKAAIRANLKHFDLADIVDRSKGMVDERR